MSDDGQVRQESVLSPWELTLRRFVRHKLGIAAFFLLIVLYGLALGCEFFAPTTREWRNLDMSYCPPQPIHFRLGDGFFVHAVKRYDNPVTFARSYTLDETIKVPLGFFVRGEAYELWGLIPWDRHFFGVDRAELAAQGRAGEKGAVFYLLGADKYGHDVLSRLFYGARISLSVGLISIVVTFILGVTLGGISGYVGGRWDNLIQRGIEVINALPQLPLWMALGRSSGELVAVVGVFLRHHRAQPHRLDGPRARGPRQDPLDARGDYAWRRGSSARAMRACSSGTSCRIHEPHHRDADPERPGMILGETVLSFSARPAPADRELGRDAAGCQNLQIVANYPWCWPRCSSSSQPSCPSTSPATPCATPRIRTAVGEVW